MPKKGKVKRREMKILLFLSADIFFFFFVSHFHLPLLATTFQFSQQQHNTNKKKTLNITMANALSSIRSFVLSNIGKLEGLVAACH